MKISIHVDSKFLIKPQRKKSVCFSVSASFALLHVNETISFLWPCPSSCPVDVCLCRTVACAVSQGAEADVEGFTHLKALEGRPQDERCPLGGREGGWGLILPSLPSPPPLPSLPLPSLFSGIASLHISTQIALCKQSQSWCRESVLNPNAASHATATF